MSLLIVWFPIKVKGMQCPQITRNMKDENAESSAPFLEREISWKCSALCILADYCQDKVLWVGSHVYPHEEKLFTNCDIYVRKIAQQELMKDLNVLGKEAVGRKKKKIQNLFQSK